MLVSPSIRRCLKSFIQKEHHTTMERLAEHLESGAVVPVVERTVGLPGVPGLGTLREFSPDLALALAGTGVTGVVRAGFRLAVAHTDRSGPESRAGPAEELPT
jgi:hypothetical protein